MQFLSDNTAPVAPEILAALTDANDSFAHSYGEDRWTARLDEVFGRFFGTPVRAFPVATGTAANALALASVCPPYGAVLTHQDAHIVRDECGAVEALTGGARLILLPGDGGRITPEALATALRANPANVHTPQPRVLSLTQVTEMGRCYRPQELRALAECAHQAGLHVHVDGARFANAIAYLGCQPRDITTDAGIDVLSFGATKNGAMAAEAVVFFNSALAADFELRRKRAGHLISKMRYVSAQLLAYVESGVWLRNARRANELAGRLGGAAGDRLVAPVESNEVFLYMSAHEASHLRALGFEFHEWGAADSGEYRFVVSWNQAIMDVERLEAEFDALRRRQA
jgi:threonine aldolase